MSPEHPSPKSIVPGVKLIIAIDRRVRNSTLDYALGAAILGLIPVYGNWIPEIRVALLTGLNLKMIVSIGRLWGYSRRLKLLAVFSSILGIAGAFILGFITWLAILSIGLFIPLLDSLARGAAYGVLTWSIGRAVSRYYYSPSVLDIDALQKALQFHRSHQHRH